MLSVSVLTFLVGKLLPGEVVYVVGSQDATIEDIETIYSSR